MAFAVSVLTISLIVSILLSRGQSMKKKYIIWGIATMLVIAPLFSWLAGILYGISVSSGFAAGGLMIIMFPILFIMGIILLVKGILKKEIN